MNFTRKGLFKELEVLILQARGEYKQECSIKCDPSLARTLGCIKEDIVELFEKVEYASIKGVKFPSYD